ncbi:hypothetical protein F0562_015878 [Nyssa sinensis]|uniref:Uncharacterized protein n=1 Tax=Nyssa sinensis TaxID=561372 RepID=A0A5J4ZKS9_9ASTE|nr:hypothetical protein F0562_015878 [Nyssa sinensis]
MEFWNLGFHSPLMVRLEESRELQQWRAERVFLCDQRSNGEYGVSRTATTQTPNMATKVRGCFRATALSDLQSNGMRAENGHNRVGAVLTFLTAMGFLEKSSSSSDLW